MHKPIPIAAVNNNRVLILNFDMLFSGITSEITEPEATNSLLIHTRKSGFACIVLLSPTLSRVVGLEIQFIDIFAVTIVLD